MKQRTTYNRHVDVKNKIYEVPKGLKLAITGNEHEEWTLNDWSWK